MAATGVFVSCGNSGKSEGVDSTNPQATETAISDTGEGVVKEFTGTPEQNGKPSVVDFYADWCGPCRSIAPLFHQLESQNGDKVNFYRVDVDQQGDVAQAYGIEAIPTFVFFDKEGKEIGRLSGADPDSLKVRVKALTN